LGSRGGRYGTIHVLSACDRDIDNRRIVVRIQGGQRRAVGRRHELAADEQLVPNRALEPGSVLDPAQPCVRGHE
jgi:hypothetical protein